jgi:hypothetical protein
MKIVDMSGKRVGHLDVLSFSHTENSRAYWFCKCVCGLEKKVAGKLLRSGQVTSCGCQKGAKRVYADYSLRRKDLREANPEKSKKWHADYRQRNKETYLANNRQSSSKHRAKRKNLHPQPVWAQKDQIDLVYAKAREFKMEVDHIVPLVSKTVCGLHVWSNLQLLALRENRSKSNKVWPDMWPRRLANTELQAITS